MYNKIKNEQNKNIGQVLTKEYLIEAVKTLSVDKIAQNNDCSSSVVRKYLHKYDIQPFNARKGKKPPTFINGDWFRNNRWYVWDEQRHKRIRRYVYRIEQHIGHEIDSTKYVVHHINGIPTDDRLENLVLLEKREHDRFHMILRNKKMKLDDTWTLERLINYLYPMLDNEMKRYAELTRTLINCKK